MYNNSVCVAVDVNWPIFFHLGTERFSWSVNNITRNLAQLNENLIVAVILPVIYTSFGTYPLGHTSRGCLSASRWHSLEPRLQKEPAGCKSVSSSLCFFFFEAAVPM